MSRFEAHESLIGRKENLQDTNPLYGAGALESHMWESASTPTLDECLNLGPELFIHNLDESDILIRCVQLPKWQEWFPNV